MILQIGMTSEPAYHQNQERLRLLSEESLAYQGQAETIEGEVAARKARGTDQKRGRDTGLQPRLF